MKIGLVILHADPGRGGAERYTVDIATALAARRHDVALIHSGLKAPADAPADAPATGPGYQRIPLAGGGLTRLRRYERFLRALDAHLDAERYDIVHAMLPVPRCNVYHPHAGVAAEAVATGHLKHRGPVSRKAASLANRFNRKRQRFVEVERGLLTGDAPPLVLCLSNYVMDAVKRHYPLPDDRLFRLFNSTDLKRFDPAAAPDARAELRRRLEIPDDKVLALIIAQDFERKGLGEAIEAVAKVADPRLLLVVVGKDAARPYQRLARELGVADRVRFAGPTADPVSFYAAADFFVLPTRHDPCSLVVLEALAMGLPVISTAQNGACEIMTDGRHGFVLPAADDVGTLAAAARALLDRDARARMSDAARSLRSELSQEKHVDRLLEAYGRAKKSTASVTNG